MKALLLYRPNSEHSTMAESYLRDFKMQTGKTLQTLDIDTPEGIEVCRINEIMQYPAILVTDDDGRQINLWVGESMPRFSEVSYYVSDNSGRSRA